MAAGIATLTLIKPPASSSTTTTNYYSLIQLKASRPLMMKRLIFLVLICSLVWLEDAAPSKGSTKASLKKKQPLTCLKACGDDYKPICAGADGRNLSFGNLCVLANYNCENNKELQLVAEGECPGGGGVRLS